MLFDSFLTITLSGEELVSPTKERTVGFRDVEQLPKVPRRGKGRARTRICSEPSSGLSGPHVLSPENVPILSQGSGPGGARGASGGKDRPDHDRDSGGSGAVVRKHLLVSWIRPGQMLSTRSQPSDPQSQPGVFQTSVPFAKGGGAEVWVQRHSLGGNAHLGEPRLRKPLNVHVYALCLSVCAISPRASEPHRMEKSYHKERPWRLSG